MVAICSRPKERPRRSRPGWSVLAMAALCIAALALSAAPAFAGQASTGELLYYPCTTCHPVGADLKPLHPLPNDFKGHQIVLEGHDKLGKGEAACLACHDDPTKNPGMLKSIDGSLVDISTGDIATVCERCHSTKYKEFKAGTHGKHKPSCVAGGCHDPHTPQFIYAAPLLPFQGTGFQFRVLPTRASFKPFPPPAPNPAMTTPGYIPVVAFLGFMVAIGLVGMLVMGRSKR